MSRLSSNNKKKRILFVNDEPDLTSLLEIALERTGFNVVTFNDPSIALEHFQSDLYYYLLPTNIPGSSSISSIRSCHYLLHWIGIISIILGNLFDISTDAPKTFRSLLMRSYVIH